MDSVKRYQMKTRMVDYQKGKIYKIVNDLNDMIHVGCTTTSLAKRWTFLRLHIQKTFDNHPFIKKLLKGHFSIVLIENYPCKYKDQLNARQSYYAKKLNAVIKVKKNISDKSIINGPTNKKKITK